MLEAIERIERYSSRGRDAFESDELIQDWVVHHLEIMGEAAAGVPDEMRSMAPEVPWSEIVGMRNLLIHGYFGIDTEIVWNVVCKDLAPLKVALNRLLSESE